MNSKMNYSLHCQSVMEVREEKAPASGQVEKLKAFHTVNKLEAPKYIPKIKMRPASVMDLAVL